MSSFDPPVTQQQEQRAAVLALGNSTSGTAAYQLLPYLQSEYSEVRRLAASGLRKLAPTHPDACTIAVSLRTLAISDPHPQVRQYALKAIATYPEYAYLYLDELKDVARDATLKSYVRSAAAEAVAAIEAAKEESRALHNHWCSRCKRNITVEEYKASSEIYFKPYCRHCFDEKRLEDVNFEATVESAKQRRTEDGTVVQSIGEKRIAYPL